MKGNQRLIWFILANLPNKYVSGLCCWCKLADITSSCENADLECIHPIDKVADNSWEAWSGSDCWAFRPRVKFDFSVDSIGLMIHGIYPEYSPTTLTSQFSDLSDEVAK